MPRSAFRSTMGIPHESHQQSTCWTGNGRMGIGIENMTGLASGFIVD
jgi:hypothetical protein